MVDFKQEIQLEKVAVDRHLQGLAGSRRVESDYLASSRAREDTGEGGGVVKGCCIPNCYIRHITRSTFVQEIHITAGLTKEVSSC